MYYYCVGLGSRNKAGWTILLRPWRFGTGKQVWAEALLKKKVRAEAASILGLET